MCHVVHLYSINRPHVVFYRFFIASREFRNVSHLKQQKYQVFVFWIFNKSYVFLSVSKRKPNCIFSIFFESCQLLILSLILYLMILNLQKISYNLPIVLAHPSINNRCAKLKKLSLVLDFLQSLCNRLKKVIAATQGRIKSFYRVRQAIFLKKD